MDKYLNIDVHIDDPKAHTLLKKGASLICTWHGKEIILHKILNGHASYSQITESELKKSKLMPDAPPVGYGLQQFDGSIFYIFDKDKVKPYVITDYEKQEQKEYRDKLKLRKTCPVCKKVQKTLDDLGCWYILEDGKVINSCEMCFEKQHEQKKIEARKVKHDFTSYFISKGIKLDEPINESEVYGIVYLDFETTGLSSIYDEIVQVSIIDNNKRVLLYKLCKPIKNLTWDEAMDINGITPADVENEQPFEAYVDIVSSILCRAKVIVCYNCPFEIGFLDKYGVKHSKYGSNRKFEDCMFKFAEIYGEWNDYFQDFKWQSLERACYYYHYEFEQAHNSLADVFATKFVYEKIISGS